MTLLELRNLFIDNPKDEIVVIDEDLDKVLYCDRAEFVDCIAVCDAETEISAFSSEYVCLDTDDYYEENIQKLKILTSAKNVGIGILFNGFFVYVRRN